MTQDDGVISVALARELRKTGLVWNPVRGDRFVVADRGMDEEVFVLSDMTIEVHEYTSGPVIGFNGTTEWALDSLEKRDALWLPTEDQLRELLGAAFVRLDRVGPLYRVVVSLDGTELTDEAPDAADAYATALLRVFRMVRGARPTPHSAE